MNAIKKCSVAILFLVTLMVSLIFGVSMQKTAKADEVGTRGWESPVGTFETSGRDGVRLNSNGGVFARANTVNGYDMNVGISFKFKVNSMPGYQGDVDAWLGIYLQTGVNPHPLEGGDDGFKFLLRDKKEGSEGGTGTAVQRMIIYPVGEEHRYTMLQPQYTSVPLLNNEHTVTIFSLGEEKGFMVALDDNIINYDLDPQTFLLQDLKNARILVNAYCNPPSKLPNWDIELGAVKQLTAEEKWYVMGGSKNTENGELSIVNKDGVAGRSETLFYKNALTIEKTTKVEITLDQIPNYLDDNKESYVALAFSNTYGNTDLSDYRTMLCMLKVKNKNVLTGNFGLASITFGGTDYKDFGLKPYNKLVIKFGFNADKIAVLTINDIVVASTDQLKPLNFIGKKSYLSVISYNATKNATLNWAYTINSVSQTDDVMPIIEEKPTDSTESVKENGGCNSASAGMALLGTLAAVFVLRSKKRV